MNLHQNFSNVSFTIKYSDNNNSVELDSAINGNRQKKKTSLSEQIRAVINSLVACTSKKKSDDISRRSLSMILEYTDEAPDDFAPVYFGQPNHTNPLEKVSPGTNNLERNQKQQEDKVTSIGGYSTEHHGAYVSYQQEESPSYTIKRRLFGEEDINPEPSSTSKTKDIQQIKSSIRSPSPNPAAKSSSGKYTNNSSVSWKSRPSFLSASPKGSVKKARGPCPYPIYSPLPPTKLRISHTPRSDNGRSPGLSEAPTIIVPSITPPKTW